MFDCCVRIWLAISFSINFRANNLYANYCVDSFNVMCSFSFSQQLNEHLHQQMKYKDKVIHSLADALQQKDRVIEVIDCMFQLNGVRKFNVAIKLWSTNKCFHIEKEVSVSNLHWVGDYFFKIVCIDLRTCTFFLRNDIYVVLHNYSLLNRHLCARH